MARQWLDRSPHSTVALCTCGWRDLTTGGDVAAWGLAAAHASGTHGSAGQAGRALFGAAKRARRALAAA
jgi:hypothetical protein